MLVVVCCELPFLLAIMNQAGRIEARKIPCLISFARLEIIQQLKEDRINRGIWPARSG